MGCDCRGGKTQILNNLKSKDHLLIAKQVYDSIVSQKTISEYDDFDKVELFQAYSALYPNSSQQPTLEDAVEKISHANNLLITKIKRR